MNLTRAKQIIESEKKINVTYKGQPVWIDGIYESNQTAQVHAEDSPEASLHVAVEDLAEQPVAINTADECGCS
ncbi:MAG: spore protein [Bacilli bacterium]|nr:spore protein [Bacilli bacterium]